MVMGSFPRSHGLYPSSEAEGKFGTDGHRGDLFLTNVRDCGRISESFCRSCVTLVELPVVKG